MINKNISKELIKLIQNKEKTIDIKPLSVLHEIISFTNESENKNVLQTLILNTAINDLLSLKYDGYFELQSNNFIHYYENTSNTGINSCQCEKCLKIFYLMEMKTNWKWIQNSWKEIKQLLVKEPSVLIFHISQLEELETIRCESDNKLLFKKLTKRAIQIKCNGCKEKHIIKFSK